MQHPERIKISGHKQRFEPAVIESKALHFIIFNDNHIAVQNLLSSRLLSRNVKIKIYKTVILPVVLYVCETLSLTLRRT
jgi:hypothetical protein